MSDSINSSENIDSSQNSLGDSEQLSHNNYYFYDPAILKINYQQIQNDQNRLSELSFNSSNPMDQIIEQNSKMIKQ